MQLFPLHTTSFKMKPLFYFYMSANEVISPWWITQPCLCFSSSVLWEISATIACWVFFPPHDPFGFHFSKTVSKPHQMWCKSIFQKDQQKLFYLDQWEDQHIIILSVPPFFHFEPVSSISYLITSIKQWFWNAIKEESKQCKNVFS